MKLWDISQPLRPGLPVWPGDTAFGAEPHWTYGPGCPVNVASVRMSTHSGTHADAPLHYQPDGAAIGAVDLAPYIGPARLVDARGWGPLITAAALVPHLAGAPPRILLRTYERFPHEAWTAAFTAIHADAIVAMAAAGVELIGVDAPSLDPQESKTMDAHLAVRDAGMRVLEGLVLDAPPPGDYELIALPLPFASLDASPVRAILRELPQ